MLSTPKYLGFLPSDGIVELISIFSLLLFLIKSFKMCRLKMSVCPWSDHFEIAKLYNIHGFIAKNYIETS